MAIKVLFRLKCLNVFIKEHRDRTIIYTKPKKKLIYKIWTDPMLQWQSVTKYLLHWHKRNVYWPRTASLNHKSQFRQHKVKTFRRVKTNWQWWSCHIVQTNNAVVMDMSTASLQASWASVSQLAVPDGVLGKIAQFMWHVKQQALQIQCTFLLCHWNKQLVIKGYHMRTLPEGLSDNVSTDLW